MAGIFPALPENGRCRPLLQNTSNAVFESGRAPAYTSKGKGPHGLDGAVEKYFQKEENAASRFSEGRSWMDL